MSVLGRPVDILPKPDAFRHARVSAIIHHVCAYCGRDVQEAMATWSLPDQREFLISGLCPECFTAICGDGEE